MANKSKNEKAEVGKIKEEHFSWTGNAVANNGGTLYLIRNT
jgi:hypothetical protein